MDSFLTLLLMLVVIFGGGLAVAVVMYRQRAQELRDSNLHTETASRELVLRHDLPSLFLEASREWVEKGDSGNHSQKLEDELAFIADFAGGLQVVWDDIQGCIDGAKKNFGQYGLSIDIKPSTGKVLLSTEPIRYELFGEDLKLLHVGQREASTKEEMFGDTEGNSDVRTMRVIFPDGSVFNGPFDEVTLQLR